MGVLIRCVVLPVIPLRRNRLTRPERMRAALEHLDSAWIKFGLILALPA
jgi:hypothetical protein